MSILYIVGTPIGNLEDITLRAISILKSVDYVICEDTRVTGKLLARIGARGGSLDSSQGLDTDNFDGPELLSKSSSLPKLLSYHAQSKISKTTQIISLLKEGKNMALVSDAGTPGISDPGAELVSILRKELQDLINLYENGDAINGLKIEAIPGPSALITALSIAGVPCADFTFLGFMPHKKGRENLFKEIINGLRTYVFYESPHRIMKTLESLAQHLGESSDIKNRDNTKVTVCRELTKIFEQVIQARPAEVLRYFRDNPDKVRGEFVVIVSKHKK